MTILGLTVPSDSSLFCNYEFEDEIIGDTLFIWETRIIEADEIKGEWLTKDIKLFYVNEGELNGSWIGHRSKQSYGSVKLHLVVSEG